MKSAFLKEVSERGLLHQATDLEGLDAQMQAGPVTAYIGFDATAPNFHIGSLMQIMVLRKLQQHGHKPLIVLGGTTTRIGDPTGTDASRKMLKDEKITQNIKSLSLIFKKYLDCDDGLRLYNNALWWDDVMYIDFLRDYGAHFTINRMLTFESVRSRLERENPMTFLEFNYLILQAVDFLFLHKKYGCLLQLGGADQWGNILNGVELIRRVTGNKSFGLTSPLITTAAGQKMGKTEHGAVWLNAQPFDFWQFWRNCDDRDVIRFLKIYTDLSLTEIEKLAPLKGTECNEAKILLADEVTRMLHGEAVLSEVKHAIESTFHTSASTTNVRGLPRKTLMQMPLSAVDLFVASGLVSSKSEARRLIQSGGARINGQCVDTVTATVPQTQEKEIKVSAGKKRHVLIEIHTTLSDY